MYLLFGSLVAFLILGYQLYTTNFVPSISINEEPISYLIIVGVIALASWLGVIYYKVVNHKKLNVKTIILFWNNK